MADAAAAGARGGVGGARWDDVGEAMNYFNSLHEGERTMENRENHQKDRQLCTFRFDYGSEPLFLAPASGVPQTTSAYQSMAATIPFLDDDGTAVNLEVVVDSGAAYTAISEDACRDQLPHCYADITQAYRHSHESVYVLVWV